jgi:hypothetical protein
MTETQHTPGPWRVFDAFTDPEIVTDRPTARETESLVQFKGQRNAKANARLMAAAPELLEALELAVQALNTARRFSVPHLETDSYAIASICDRSIRKAKGGDA